MFLFFLDKKFWNLSFINEESIFPPSFQLHIYSRVYYVGFSYLLKLKIQILLIVFTFVIHTLFLLFAVIIHVFEDVGYHVLWHGLSNIELRQVASHSIRIWKRSLWLWKQHLCSKERKHMFHKKEWRGSRLKNKKEYSFLNSGSFMICSKQK